MLCVLLISAHRILRCTCLCPVFKIHIQSHWSFSLEWQEGREDTYLSVPFSVLLILFSLRILRDDWGQTLERRNYEIRWDIHILMSCCTGGLWSEDGAKDWRTEEEWRVLLDAGLGCSSTGMGVSRVRGTHQNRLKVKTTDSSLTLWPVLKLCCIPVFSHWGITSVTVGRAGELGYSPRVCKQEPGQLPGSKFKSEILMV